VSARNLNPRQIALDGVNWHEHVGEHPLGFPRGEQYLPHSYNAHRLVAAPHEALGYHVTAAAHRIRGIQEEGIRPSWHEDEDGNDRGGVYVMPEGHPVAHGYANRDERGGVFQTRAPKEHYQDDPAEYHPGAKRVVTGPPEDRPPLKDTRLVGHISMFAKANSHVTKDIVHWGTMDPHTCETCNTIQHHVEHKGTWYPEPPMGRPVSDRLSNLRGYQSPATAPERNETLAGWFDLPGNEHDNDFPYVAEERQREQHRLGEQQ
jgi:hypothetical protein